MQHERNCRRGRCEESLGLGARSFASRKLTSRKARHYRSHLFLLPKHSVLVGHLAPIPAKTQCNTAALGDLALNYSLSTQKASEDPS